MVHAKVEDAFTALGDRLFLVRSAHDRSHPGRHVDRRFPALANTRRILRRYPAAIFDGLALAEQEGRLLAGSLRRREPLERSGFGRALVSNDQPLGVWKKTDCQWRAEV